MYIVINDATLLHSFALQLWLWEAWLKHGLVLRLGISLDSASAVCMRGLHIFCGAELHCKKF